MTDAEKRAFNAGLERAAEIAQPSYAKREPGQWALRRIEIARRILSCKVEITGA